MAYDYGRHFGEITPTQTSPLPAERRILVEHYLSVFARGGITRR
jgi:hypothetical protein